MKKHFALMALVLALSAVTVAQNKPGDFQFNYAHTFGAGDYQALTWTPVKTVTKYGFTWEVGPGLANDLQARTTAVAGFARGVFVYDAKEVKVAVGPSFFGFYTPSTGSWLGRAALSLTVTFPGPG